MEPDQRSHRSQSTRGTMTAVPATTEMTNRLRLRSAGRRLCRPGGGWRTAGGGGAGLPDDDGGVRHWSW